MSTRNIYLGLMVACVSGWQTNHLFVPIL